MIPARRLGLVFLLLVVITMGWWLSRTGSRITEVGDIPVELAPTETEISQSFADSIVQVWSPRFLDEHRIVFADQRDHRVLILDWTTGSLEALGRYGSGPGEFRGPSVICVWPGKGFFVWDVFLLRLSSFGANLQPRQVKNLSIPPSFSPSIAILQDEGLVAVAPSGIIPEYSHRSEIWLLDEELNAIGTISRDLSGIAPGTETSRPFLYRAIGAGLNGTILVGISDDYTVHRLNRDGSIVSTLDRLDETFRPPILYRSSGGGPPGSRVMNTIDVLVDLSSTRMAIACTVSDPERIGVVSGYVDIRDSGNGALIRRIPLPDGLRVGDIRQRGGRLEILGYEIGVLMPPSIRLFSVPVGHLGPGWNGY